MRSFKKIAAMIMAVAMLCSFTALAATVELEDITNPDSDNPSVTLGYTANTDAAQRTMLVYKGTELAGADIVYIDQFAENADAVELQLGTDAEDYGTYTVIAGGMDVVTTDTKTFTYTMLAYDVTITGAGDGGYVTNNYTGTVTDEGVLVDVPKGTTVTLGFMPYMGYQIKSIMVGDEDRTTTVASTGGTLEVPVTADVTVAVEFEAIAADEAGQAFTAAEVYDLPATTETGADSLASKLFFGKGVAANGKTIDEMGMFIEKKISDTEWEGVTGSHETGPYFAAANYTADNQYGIRFYGLEKGTYRATSYIKYAGDAAPVTGNTVIFEVK